MHQPLHRLKVLSLITVMAFITWCVTCKVMQAQKQQAISITAINTGAISHVGQTCFMVVSDIHLHQNLVQDDITPTGAADSGHDLWDTAQNKIKRILQGGDGFSAPKFIIVLGDLPWHANADLGAEVDDAHHNSGQVLRDLRGMAEKAQVPLLYVSGNNDAWGGDYRPFSTQLFDMDPECKTWPIIAPQNIDDVSEKAMMLDDTHIKMGYYSAYPLGHKAGLRVIVLNTTMFVHKYTEGKEQQQTQATAQMDWLAQQLKEVADNNEHTIIAMHVPPGLDGYKKKDFWRDKLTYNGENLNDAFLTLVNKYQNRIITLLSSHTHMDGLRKLYDKQGRMTVFDISAPGITPGHANNPGFKMVSYRPDTYALMDITTLYENFYPQKKVVSWGNDEFNFSAVFNTRGASIRTFLDTVNNQTLQKGVEGIYKVMNGPGNPDEVDTAIYVKYN